MAWGLYTKNYALPLHWQNNLVNTTKLLSNINTLTPPLDSYKYIQNSVFLSSTFLNSFKHYRSLPDLTDVSKIISSITLSQKVASSFALNFSELTRIQSKINEIYGESFLRDINLASDRILDSVASLRATIELCKIPNELIMRSLEISNSYQCFAKKQYKYAEDNESIAETALTITDHAGDMVINTQSSTELGCELLISISEYEAYNGGPLLSNRSNIFPMLNLHLSYLYRSDLEKKNIEKAIENSIPALINRLGCQIIELVYRINSCFQGIDGSSIFKLTNKTFYAASVLPSYVATNETGFAEIIDYLFFVLYEGSGTAKRLIPISNDEQLQPIWLIKHFRQEFRHDLEHGDRIEKKIKNAGDAFRAIISKSKPISTIDWKIAQVKLYELIVIMLSDILIKLESVETPSIS